MSEGAGGDGLAGIACSLRALVSGFEPGVLEGESAVVALQLFGEIERLGAAGKALAARRVEVTRAWQSRGTRSAAHLVASMCGSSVRSAVETLETARRLDDLPVTASALRSGKLSSAQAREIVSVAGDRPGVEAELVAAAGCESLPALQQRCRAVRAEGSGAVDAYERVRARRYLRHWSDGEGGLRLEARLCADQGAKVLAALDVERRRIFATARRDGRREPYEAYGADALVALAERSGGNDSKGPAAVVHVRVDHAALMRGHTEDGETCDVPGVGPIPVATARDLAQDCILKVLVTNGVDVVAVAHSRRSIPAHIRTALEIRDPVCVIPGCDVRERLEIDHLIPWAEGGPTTLHNLARACHFHHYLKTHQGWIIGGRPGAWTWDPPDQAPP